MRAGYGTITSALRRTITMRFWLPAYLFFAALVCWTCYRQPIAAEFDRWMYDAVVRTNLGQSIDHVFEVVKHSSPRIEQSTAVASPGHLGIIEPMFAIKAMYVEVITLMAKAGVPIEKSISLASVVALFAIALIIGLWTRNPLLSALLVISPACVELGRSGTPDALSAAVVLGGLWAFASDRVFLALSLLLISVWVRTDNVLLVLTVILWLLWTAKLRPYQASVAALLAIASVFAINHFSGNYGWLVLFRCSFLVCRPPLDNLPRLTLKEYFSVFIPNLEILAPRAALWLLLGLAAWRMSRRWRPLLSIIVVTVVGHFLLFPSPEERTLIWAFLAAGVAFVLSLKNGESLPAFA